MRKKILIPCLIVLAICLLLVFLKTKQQSGTVVPMAESPLTNQPVQAQKSRVVEQHQATNFSQIMSALAPNPSPQAQALAKTNPMAGLLLASWQSPIEFYGRVVDESNNPVIGASISFHWMETPSNSGSRSLNIKSDANGLFSLRNAFGPTLTVSVSKEGYYTSRSIPDGYHFQGNETHHPDPFNPVVFHLQKKGVGEQLITMKRNYRIPRDGTPVSVDLTTGATATSEGGDFVVQCWTQDAGKRSGEKYDWRCVVSIPGGGAVTNNEEFAFEAPEEGYVPSLEIAMPADRPDWQDDVDMKFYYRLADGRYGRMTFSMIAGGQHFCMIDSILNPSGSRNLESK